MSQPVITQHQISMTEWLAAIGQTAEANLFREEDNQKAKRLEILYQVMGTPYERPEKFSAKALTDLEPEFNNILEKRGEELCAIRLVPNKADLPKLRQRGLSIHDCYYNWYKTLNIKADDYDAFICPHSETLLWSATFVINDKGVYGEIVSGLHSQLTHGYIENQLYQFSWDFDEWQWSPEVNQEASEQIKRMLELLKTDRESVMNDLKQQLNSDFTHGYLKGYFEATVWPDNKVYIIDYNRLLSNYLPDFIELKNNLNSAEIKGVCACPGLVQGKVNIIKEPNDSIVFQKNDILVCDMTDVRYLPYMKDAAAIITDRGSILSHAAIIARELGKPCIIGTKVAAKVLCDGDEVEVDANEGVVTLLKRVE